MIKLDTDKIEPRSEPFPIFLASDFLEPEAIEALNKEFPNESIFENSKRVMGGRNRIPNSTEYFFSFLNKNPTWLTLYNELNSEKTFFKFLHIFENQIQNFAPLFDVKDLIFDPLYLENLLNRDDLKKYRSIGIKRLTDTSIKEALSYVYLRTKFKILNWLQWRLPTKKRVVLFFDISVATNGYTREIHRDNDGKLLVGLIYIDDFISAKGGEFLTHKHNRDNKIEDFSPQADENETTVCDRILAKKNIGCMFLSVRNSYHSVPIIEDAVGKRKFIYFSYGLVDNAAWKNKFSLHYNKYFFE